MKNCLDCGAPLRGRRDKKFCDGFCRNHYNNLLNRGKDDALKKINSILKKNTGILEKLCKNGNQRISKQALLISGFNFNYSTHQVHGKTGVYICCYYYGYQFISETELILEFFESRG